MKEMGEEMLQGTHYNQQDMKRRLAKYRKENNSQIAEPSLSDFFKQKNTEVYVENATNTKELAFKGFKIFIERVILLVLIS